MSFDLGNVIKSLSLIPLKLFSGLGKHSLVLFVFNMHRISAYNEGKRIIDSPIPDRSKI